MRVHVVLDLAAIAPMMSAPEGRRPREEPLRHEWRLVDGEHWQIVSDEVEDPAVTDAAEGTGGGCPPAMVEVQGPMK
jgi:hypothetical protein